MTQGIYVDGNRPKTKKELKDAIAANVLEVSLEATSMFGNEYDGCLNEAPSGNYYVVGPDPYRSRKWYAHIAISGTKIVVK